MRFKKVTPHLELYVVSGIHTVLLSFDMPKERSRDLLGFAIERRTHSNNQRIWLEGMKCFESLVAKPKAGETYPSNQHPIQSFFWMDFAVEPGETYTYQVTPVYGASPAQLRFEHPTEIEVHTEPYASDTDEHEVYFNRGVSGSQYYARRFGTEKISKLKEPKKTEALNWLQSGLYDGFLEFIQQAKKGEKLCGAFYELKYPPAVEALKKASVDRDVEVRIICDGRKGVKGSYFEENKETVDKAKAQRALNLRYRDVKGLKIPHNKFLILCDKNGAPKKVWTGSTNISEKAFFGHCNTGHVIKNSAVAEKYLRYWNQLYAQASMAALKSLDEELQAQPPFDQPLPNQPMVFFSPRSTSGLLNFYANAMDKAKQVVCAVFPFNVDDAFQTIFEIDKSYLRFVIIDKKGKNNRINSEDRDLKVTYGDYVGQPVYQWIKEASAGKVFYGGVNYVHNKFILIDPLSADPMVITGSANFSKPSLVGNEENTLLIKGNKRVADIYLTEHTRLYNHFYFRYFLQNNSSAKKLFKPYLAEDSKWVEEFYVDNDFSCKRKLLFKHMVL